MTLNLSGLTAAQVTPFTEGGRELDLDWLPAHIEYLRDKVVQGPQVQVTQHQATTRSLHSPLSEKPGYDCAGN
jgi:hypothetical protein